MASSPGCRAMRTWCSSGIGSKECRAARSDSVSTRIVAITAGTSGIGRVVAEAFLEHTETLANWLD